MDPVFRLSGRNWPGSGRSNGGKLRVGIARNLRAKYTVSEGFKHMDQQDYSDHDDFFTQDFRQPGLASVWLALPEFDSTRTNDALQTLAGVGYYNLDDQETNGSDSEPLSIDKLLAPISYSQSFSNQIVEAANSKGIFSSRWVLVQFDFAYDRSRARRPIDPTLLYIATVPYQTD